jgi:hypothetical protein
VQPGRLSSLVDAEWFLLRLKRNWLMGDALREGIAMRFGFGPKPGSEASDASDRSKSAPRLQPRAAAILVKPRIPLIVKILLTLFVCILVPAYYRAYGPANFLAICDVALLATLLAVWLESALLISMQAVATAVPQGIWLVDFLVR